MGSISNPWAFCKNLSTLIVFCTLLIRVLSIGYVICGFVIKFQNPLLLYNVIPTVNQCKLGIFPLGSFINALIFAPTPAVIVNVLNSLITYLGICKRRKHYLQISTIISLLNLIWFVVLIGLWSWLINEIQAYNDIKECYAMNWEQNKYYWNYIPMFNVSECCGVDRPTTPPGSTPSPTECPFSVGCFDIFSNKIHTYGRSYIAALVVSCTTEIVMIVGTNYLHGLYAILLKSTPEKTIDSKEMHKLRNGAIVSMCLSLKENWTRNKLSSFFGYMSVFSLAIDGTIILAICLSRYNYHDLTLTDGFYQISGANNINIGYTKDALLITAICVLMWSILAKALSLGGMRLMKRWLFVSYIISEIIAMLVECIILIFSGLIIRALYCCFWKDSSECSEYTYPTSTVSTISYVCDYWEDGALFVWRSTGILIFHIILKVVFIVIADRVYKGSFSAAARTTQSNSEQIKNDSVGFFNDILQKTKKYPMISAVVGISIIICIVDCLYFCGLLVVRYGYTTGNSLHVADVLNGITFESLRMSSNWDNAIIICLVSLSFSFSLQLGKLVSITWQSPKWTLLILWLELLVIILQFVSLSLVSLLLRLVYCCLYTSNCDFSYDESGKKLCANEQNVWERFMLQSWLMFGFGVLCTVLQILSIIFGYRYFKKSADGNLGIFKGVLELFRSMLHTISHNRCINEKKMPNYNKTYGVYSIISATCLVLEFIFVVCLYAYFFTEGNSSYTLDSLDHFTYFYHGMGSLYRGVSITILVIIPLATTLRIAAFVWFGFQKSKISFYTILVIILLWTLGEIVVLCLTSYILRLAYECNDSDSFQFSTTTSGNRSTICENISSKLFVQFGFITAFLVLHIILNICVLLTMDVMHPYIVLHSDKRRVSLHLFYKAVEELKKQNHLQRSFVALLAISLVLNFAFWIGLILMGLIPGYIHTPTGFLDIISRITISFGSIDMESAVLGIMYSLIAVVPLFGANHIIGLVGIFKQSGIIIWVFIISLFVFGFTDLVYLTFSSEMVHFRNCKCEKEANCTQYSLITEKEQNIVCGDLFLDSSSVFLAYILLTVIMHVVVFVLSVKILRGFSRTKVGIDEENKNISRETNQQPNFEVENSKFPTKRKEKNISSKSIDRTESIAIESENNLLSNISTEKMLNKQQRELNSEKKKQLNKRQHNLRSEKKKKKKKSNLPNERMEEKFNSSSIDKNESIALESENSVLPNKSTEQKLNNQEHELKSENKKKKKKRKKGKKKRVTEEELDMHASDKVS